MYSASDGNVKGWLAPKSVSHLRAFRVAGTHATRERPRVGQLLNRPKGKNVGETRRHAAHAVANSRYSSRSASASDRGEWMVTPRIVQPYRAPSKRAGSGK